MDISLCLFAISICFVNVREQNLFPCVYKTYAYSIKTQSYCQGKENILDNNTVGMYCHIFLLSEPLGFALMSKILITCLPEGKQNFYHYVCKHKKHKHKTRHWILKIVG